MDDENDFIVSEAPTYPFPELIADIGGTTGLFLGLSVMASVPKTLKIIKLDTQKNSKHRMNKHF